MRPRKPKAQQAVRLTISMPMTMFAGAVDRQQREGLTNFSAYIQSLLRRDQRARPVAQPVQQEQEVA